MKTIEISGQDWPVRFDFSAIQLTLPLFGYSRLADVDKMLKRMSSTGAPDEDNETAKGFPVDAIAPFIRAVVRSGLRYTRDDRDAPQIDEIEDGINADMALLQRVMEAMSEDKTPDEKPAGKKTKPGTTKQ